MTVFTRRQILLKREDGAPAGFMRMERVDNRCDVEVHVDAKLKELTALLLDGEKVFPLGRITRNRAFHAPRIDDIHRYDCAAVLSSTKLLFVGGENVDFNAVEKALERKALVVREAKASPAEGVLKKDQTETRRPPGDFRRERGNINATDDELDRAKHIKAGAEHSSARLAQAGTARAADSQPVVSSTSQENQKYGWSFTPCPVGDFLCFFGRLTQDGKAIATMHALTGMYAPEPPPGLPGFVWDSGYWVKVALHG